MSLHFESFKETFPINYFITLLHRRINLRTWLKKTLTRFTYLITLKLGWLVEKVLLDNTLTQSKHTTYKRESF